MICRILLIFLIYSLPLFAGKSDGITRLLEGNQRFVQEFKKNPRRTAEQRAFTTSSQEPFAVIVGCSDSRVSPEIVFDQGIGDLFVVRNAGNTIGPIELESILFSVEHLNSSVILVLGHENCGAVQAIINGQSSAIPAIAKMIEPSVLQERKKDPTNLLKASIQANAVRMTDILLSNPLIKQRVDQKKLSVYAGYYNLDSGLVQLVPSSKN